MFSSMFPIGLRVLAFDKDLYSLHILKKYLHEFQYEVLSYHEEEIAMFLLRNFSDMFDIAIVDAQYSDGDRFRMISEIASKIDLPIIIISKDDSVNSVINWMRNGVCDYLIKPIGPEDIRLIFKHVVRKMEITSVVAVGGEAEEKAAAEKSSSAGDSTRGNPNNKKRNMFFDGQTDEEDQDELDRVSTTKKRRVVWDDELHGKFVEAVNYFGIDKAVPKKILKMMNVPRLTRENVASHLQKYRLSLKNQRNDQKKERKQTNDQSDQSKSFPTHHINNIPQPSSHQQQNTNSNLISPLGHHDDDRNLVMNHQHHHPYQISESAWIDQNAEERLFDDEQDEEITNMIRSFTQKPEAMTLFPFPEPAIATTEANDSQSFSFTFGSFIFHT